LDPERVGERYRHIDALFGEPGRNVIDWDLIQNHWAHWPVHRPPVAG
jgi:hypothetical protein